MRVTAQRFLLAAASAFRPVQEAATGLSSAWVEPLARLQGAPRYFP